jgi:hypothetical protein
VAREFLDANDGGRDDGRDSRLDQLATLITLVQRVVLQIPVQIRHFNSQQGFFAPMYRNFLELFQHTYKEFGLQADQYPNPRFYWLPLGDLTTAQRLKQRIVLRNESDWRAFLDRSDQQDVSLITLYFVSGDQSPSQIERPAPPSPPRLPSSDHEEERSEPASVNGLASRDGDRCFVCGESNPVAAHIVDKGRAELLDGAPDDAPGVDDVRNCFQLCPNHHYSFDRFEWTLVKLSSDDLNGSDSVRFCVRPGPGQPTSSISSLMQRVYSFSSADRAPPAYLFLLKQLGRFQVPCRVCNDLYLPSAIYGHYGGAHNNNNERSLWKDQPHLLPRPCNCTDRGSTVWELYCHVLLKHNELLYA